MAARCSAGPGVWKQPVCYVLSAAPDSFVLTALLLFRGPLRGSLQEYGGSRLPRQAECLSISGLTAQHQPSHPQLLSTRPGQSSLSAGALRYRAWAQSWSSAALAARSVLPSTRSATPLFCRRAGNWASRPGHRALARSSLLRWFTGDAGKGESPGLQAGRSGFGSQPCH